MQNKQIRDFRKILRQFEREIDYRVNSNCCRGLSLPQCHVMLELGELEHTTIANLAQSLNLDKSTVSRTIDSLVNMKMVKRVENADDRRYAIVSLTKQGLEAFNQLNKLNDSYFKRVFESIPKNEHNKLVEHFKLLTNSMTKNNSHNRLENRKNYEVRRVKK
jgi:DNA-binding MarR family transcriptional regulator